MLAHSAMVICQPLALFALPEFGDQRQRESADDQLRDHGGDEAIGRKLVRSLISPVMTPVIAE